MPFVIVRRALLATCTLCIATVPLTAQPTLEPIGNESFLSGSPVHFPLVGHDPTGGPLVFTAESSDPELVATHILEGNRSLRIVVTDFGEMIFELFEARVPRATSRIIAFTESGLYDGVLFHRVIDRFVIQGGDPDGDGIGNPELGLWDDQFHVDLQHNRRGVLSMAKSGDDTNDSQFFVTELATRHLDFDHTIFGQLVVGEDVRQAISTVPTDTADRPLTPVVMERVEVFQDTQNGLLMLKAPEGTSGTAEITVTATDAAGLTAQQTFSVNIAPDNLNSPPFLADIPVLTTRVNTEFTYQLVAIDVEGDTALFLDEATMDINGLPVPARAPGDLVYAVDSETGVLRVTPQNGLTGTFLLSVATAVSVFFVDFQAVTIQIDP